MVLSPPRLLPLTDCTTNYRPVLSSERAHENEEQKKGKSKIWSWAPKKCPTPRNTDRLTVSLKVTSTSTSVRGVSDETVMYGYESSATLTTDRLHYKLQTRPLVREGRILPPESLRVIRGDGKGTQ
jgi:hypothetical protein